MKNGKYEDERLDWNLDSALSDIRGILLNTPDPFKKKGYAFKKVIFMNKEVLFYSFVG